MARSALLNVMVEAARKAGKRLARDFGEVQNLQVSVKGPGDFVSAADMMAEKIIFEELSKARPKFGFLMEERGVVEGSDPQNRWIVDPLDGTTNFLHGIPLFGISIALEREGEIVAAIVYNPVMDELFAAEKGRGAFVNDRRIRVAARRRMTDCVFTTGIPHLGRPAHGDFLEQQRRVMLNSAGVRRFGAAAIDLCWVAAGRFDGFWETGLSPWDMAAGILMVREAGGYVSDLDDGQDMLAKGSIIAGNELIRKQLLETVRGE
ncbi:MAG: inositol monophosphatase [Nitratireductor sp.]|nr:inositol monophosphatase [Nitratireductor sp.]